MKENTSSFLIKNYTLGSQPYLTTEDRILEIKSKLKQLDKITSIAEAKKITQMFMSFHENVNRIIRRFVYKGTDISSYDDNYINSVQYYINNIPRKIHNGKSALEIANEFGFT